MSNALLAARRLGLRTVQVFVRNQRQWTGAPLRDEDVQRWHELRASTGIYPIVAHASYLINLASPDPHLRRRSIAALADEMQRCARLQIPYLVVHPGSAVDQPVSRALECVAASIECVLRLQAGHPVMLLLETTAGQGSALGSSLEQLGWIIRRLARPQRLGLCLDTCHLFAAGYDIRDPQQYEELIRLARREVGLPTIRCWHLNDSKTPLGSRVDRHEHIGRGCIGPAGFRNVLSDPRFRGLPMIIETPKGPPPLADRLDRLNIRRLRALAADGPPGPATPADPDHCRRPTRTRNLY